MKWILILFSLAFSRFSFAATVDVYACDSCDYDKAVVIAKEHPKLPNCRWEPVNGGQIEFGSSLFICDTSSTDLIIANARTKKAFKFNVKTTNISSTTPNYGYRSTVKDLSLSSAEIDLLHEFYTIDQDFKNAVSSVGTTTFNSTQLFAQLNISSNDNSCTSHPTGYFDNLRTQNEIHDGLTSKITEELDGAAWFDFIEDTDFTGGGLTLSKGSLGFQISLQHNEIGTFVTKVYEDTNNMLNFEVKYHGEIDLNGDRKLALSYKLNRGVSTIDGIRMNMLFAPTVDLSGTLISNCLRDLIERNSEEVEIITPGGGTVGDPGDSSGAGMCLKKVKTTVCSTDHNGVSCTRSIINIPC